MTGKATGNATGNVTGTDGSLPRFLAVGGAMSLLYATLAALATAHLPLPTWFASAMVWVLCIPLGFWAHRRFSFAGRRQHRHAPWLYAATQGLGICITAGISLLLARGLFWPDLAVHLLASAIAAVASYVINRWLVFPQHTPA